MQRTTLRVRLREQVRPGAGEGGLNSGRLKKGRADGVRPHAGYRVMDEAVEGFRTHTAMNHPLLAPCCLEGCGGDSPHPISDFGLVKGDKTFVRAGAHHW
jgi:hypothetical protein